MAAFTPPEAQRVTNRVGQWDRIDVRADPGVSQTEVRDNIRKALADAGDTKKYQAITADDYAKEQANTIKDNLSFFNTFLLVFALISLFVGAFIIYNTFSITVQQRGRELGLLRALGASGRQVVGSVALEAIVVGIFSSIVGLVLGIAIVKPLEGLFSLFGADLPSGSLQIEPRTIIVSLLVGTVITFVSAIAPARRPPGSRRSPRCATRPASVRRGPPPLRLGHDPRASLGLIALFVGLFGNSSGNNGAILVGVAALLRLHRRRHAQPADRPARGSTAHVAGGALQEHHRSARPRERDAEPAPHRVHVGGADDRSRAGELHRDHRRRPSRARSRRAIDNQIKADFVLSPKNFQGFSPEAATAVRKQLPGSTVVQFRGGQVLVNGVSEDVTGASANFERVANLKLRPGFDRQAYADGGVIAYKDAEVDGKKVKPGQTAEGHVPEGRRRSHGRRDLHRQEGAARQWRLRAVAGGLEPVQRAARPVRARPQGRPLDAGCRQGGQEGRRTRSAASAPTTRPSSRTVRSRSSTRSST